MREGFPVKIKKIILVLSLLALWPAIIGIGEYILLNYEKTPGVLANAPSQWPSGTSIERHPDFMTLLMFVHPHCPCTRASIGELAILMAHCRNRLRVNVIFLKPEKFTEDWAKTDTFKMVAAIPDIKIRIDEDGLEARRFGASTSGQVLLYRADGQLLFNGGITASRGHAGDNTGRSAIESLVLKGGVEKRQTPVFGCSLMNHKINLFQEIMDLWKNRKEFCLFKQI